MKCGDISSVRNIWKMMDRRVLIREVGLYLYTSILPSFLFISHILEFFFYSILFSNLEFQRLSLLIQFY